MRALAFSILTLALSCSALRAATVTFASPALDKWLYGNVSGEIGGQADAAPVFANLESSDEDRLGTFLVGFNTSGSIPAGRGVQNYQISRVRLTLSVLSANTFIYDGTHDLVSSYQTGAVDADAGRPIEVFGVGLRSPYTTLRAPVSGATTSQYHENSPYANAQGQRYAYPLALGAGGQTFDASDNVSAGLEALPFGVGVAALEAGSLVPADTTFTFTIDISSPAVLDYIRSSLNAGLLGFIASSLHNAAGQGGPQTYPRFYTREGAVFAPEFAPSLEVEYTVVPEPQTAGLLLAGLAFLAGRRRRQSSLCS